MSKSQRPTVPMGALTNGVAAARVPEGVRLKQSLVPSGTVEIPSCMKALNAARADRLAAARELLESLHGPDGRPADGVDLDTVAEVMTQLLQEVGTAPVQREMDLEEETIFHGLGTLLIGIQDMLYLLAEKQKGGSYRNTLMEVRRAFWSLVITPRLQLLSPERQAEVWLHSEGWGYSLWAPGHQVRLLEILRRVATGKRSFTKDLAEAAQELYDHLKPNLPMSDEYGSE